MSPPPPPERVGPVRSIAVAGYLAYLYGIFGILTGLAAAGTFIPYASQSTYDPALGGLFTGIAVAGTAVSAMGVIAGWGLFRARTWAWNTAVGVGLACVGLNAVMAALWPGYGAFLAVIAVAYGLMLLLLLIGRGSYPSRSPRSAAA